MLFPILCCCAVFWGILICSLFLFKFCYYFSNFYAIMYFFMQFGIVQFTFEFCSSKIGVFKEIDRCGLLKVINYHFPFKR